MKGSGRTVGKSRGHRPWFGRQQAKKKAAGNAAHQQGDECVEGAGVPATPPSLTSLRCRGRRLRTAKKKGVFPKHPRVRRIAPSPKKHPNDDVRFSDKSSPSRQNDGCGQQLKKKTGLPRRYGYKRLPVLSGADRYDSSASTRGMTEAGQNRTFMEFALLALFSCSLASVIATVFRGTY